jgi:hypothetical protein
MTKNTNCTTLLFMIFEANFLIRTSGGDEKTGTSLVMISAILINSFWF